jgi:hypothetical protein
MDQYWYFLKVEHAPPNHQLWVLVNTPKKSGERIELPECLGYVERMHNGRWLCFVRFERHAKCIGEEPSREEGQRLVMRYYRGMLYHGRVTTQTDAEYPCS